MRMPLIGKRCYGGLTMGCYIIPLMATLVQYGMRKKIPALAASPRQGWLTMMLGGASVFGVIDHAWNGELLMVSANPGWDLALGAVITAAVCGIWALVTATHSRSPATTGA
jgi:hypothetical protein